MWLDKAPPELLCGTLADKCNCAATVCGDHVVRQRWAAAILATHNSARPLGRRARCKDQRAQSHRTEAASKNRGRHSDALDAPGHRLLRMVTSEPQQNWDRAPGHLDAPRGA